MKKIFTSKIYYLFFAFLFLAGILLINPVSKSFKAFSNSITNKVASYLEENFGISVTYQSLSPSLLTQLSIKKIEVTNQDDELVGNINSIKVKYRLFKILKGDIQNGITSVTFEGARIDISKILSLIETKQNIKTEQENKVVSNNKEQIKSFQDIKKFFPYKCYFKNLSIYYESDVLFSDLTFNKVSLNTDDINNNLSIDFSSDLRIIMKKFFDNKKVITSNIDFSGKINSDFTSSQMTLNFSNITDGIYNINQLNLFADYHDKNLDVRTIQSVLPLNFELKYLDSTGTVSGALITQKLKPTSFMSYNQKKSMPYNLDKMSFSSKSDFTYIIHSKKSDFNSEGDFTIPTNDKDETVKLSYSIFGNNELINLEYLTLDGKRWQGNASFEYKPATMQLAGIIDIPNFLLPSGEVLSTEIFFDPLDLGFMIFSPQIYVGNNALTALQLSFLPQPKNDTYDFTFEVSDYSYLEQEDPGIISLNGSYLKDSKYFQANANVNSLFIDSVLDFASSFVKDSLKNQIRNINKNLSDYMLSGDLYFSSDFKTFSYNVPYILAANTKVENQVLMLSCNGNSEAFQIDNFSVVYNKLGLECSGLVEYTQNFENLLFSFDLKNGSIPYHFSGSKDKNLLTVSGDYGFLAEVDLNKISSKEIYGTIGFNSLPLVFDDMSFLLSVNVLFNYDKLNGPYVHILNFETEVSNSFMDISPKLLLNGNITKHGAQIHNISITDSYSLMEGYLNVVFNKNDSIFESVVFQSVLTNKMEDEKISIDGKMSNPELNQISFGNILETLYLDLQLQINNFNLNRFSKNKHENNTLSVSMFAGGILKNPYVVLNVEEMRLLLINNFMNLKGTATIEDKVLSVSDCSVKFENININNIKIDAALDSLTCNAYAVLNTVFDGLEMNVPLYLDLYDVIKSKKGIVPDSFKVNFKIKDSYGPFIAKPILLDVSGIYLNNNFTFFSNDNSGINGVFTNSGILNATIDAKNKIFGNVSGTIKKENVSLLISDAQINLKEIFSYLNIQRIIKVEEGSLNGYVNLTGTFNKPLLKGALKIDNPKCILPMFCNEVISTSSILATINKDEIKIVPNVYKVKNKEKLKADCVIYLNKWILDHIEANVSTIDDEYVKGGLNIPEFRVWGDIEFNINLFFEKNVLQVGGLFLGENVDFTSGMSQVTGLNAITMSGRKKAPSKMKVVADLEIILGTHSIFNFEPLLRCVLEPNSKIKAIVDQQVDLYQIIGDVGIRSGDIAYLNRNFYIKKGNVVLNPEDFTNPIITINAETREKDDSGENVRIILDVKNQHLQSLSPRFSSIPAKSETELRSLLGDIVLADSETATNFLVAAGDYAIQSAVMRKAENKLRDFMNFDIFSLRTNILQNTVNYGVNNQISNKITMATLLDNTTLYIGKYITSSIYFDAMLHVSVDDKFSNHINGINSFMFQPEFGLELESPFVNIRWNMAPDVNALLKKQFVPSTSVTLSWKMAF